jgi:phospholipid-translocating ATPase
VLDENKQKHSRGEKRAIIIDGTQLTKIYSDTTVSKKNQFLAISQQCEAVICCRVSPGQKAEVVRMIKNDDPHILTMAVGDGANDVAMIREAHVGIGLYGNEGNLAS